MTATYNPSLTAAKDRIRFAVGDTDVSQALIQDETIAALMGQAGATEASVAAAVAQNILTQYSHRVSYDVDGQGQRFSDLAKNYAGTVALLLAKAKQEAADEADEDQVASGLAIGGGIMVGGLSRSENVDRSEDRDRAANYSPRYGL